MKRKLLTLLLVLASVFGIFAIANKTSSVVKAANTDNSKESWYAIGTINGTSWNTDFPLSYNEATDRYELVITLAVNNEFKIRLNKSWTTSIGYGGKTGDGISTYLSNSGGNFKVKTAGNYVLWVKDDNVRNYGDKSYGFGIEPYVEVIKEFKVTHHSFSGEVLKEESVQENSLYMPAFEEVEGYRLEGWYTNKELTKKMEKGTQITADLVLYPKYVEVSDYVVYFEDNGTLGSEVYVYMYSDSFDGHFNNAWPGVKLEKTEKGYLVQVDASKSFDKIIFNGGNDKPQTANLDLNCNNGDTYILGAKDSEGKYTATVKATGVSYSFADLINTHYNGGVYTRTTHIYIDKDAIAADFGTHFHNAQGGDNVHLDRTTKFVDDYLYFVETGVAFGTSADGKLTQFTWEGSYANSDSDVNAIENAFYTLFDLMNAEAEWTYADGVYTTTNKTVIKIAEGFTAPGWQSPTAAYTDYTQVTVSVNEAGQLVVSLWVSATNSGIVTSTAVGDHVLFAEAIIG